MKDNKIIFQHTIKDINTISFVSQNEIEINTINPVGFNLLEKDDKYILFSNIDNYYIIDLSSYDIAEKGISKIFPLEQVDKTLGTSFFYLNNHWVYIDTHHPYQESKIVELSELTSNLQIIHKDKDNRRWLLKDDTNYYSFTDRKLKLIPNLNIKTTRFYQTDYHLGEFFLYDEDTFYLLNYNLNYKDVTSNFKLERDNNNLLEIIFYNAYNDLYLKENDSLIWTYNKNGIHLNEGLIVYFYPLKGKFINKHNSLIEINGNVYFNSQNAINQSRAMDITIIEDIESFRKISYGDFVDKFNTYRYNFNSGKLQKMDKINENAIFFPSVNYYSLVLSSFYKEGDAINYYDNSYNIVKSRKINTEIKNLTLAYAYNKVVVIEDKEIPNIADINTLEFLGSTVHIISGCDGGDGKIDVVIKYFYFFKDQNHIYSYYSGKKAMKIIENLKPSTKNYSSFTALKELQMAITNPYKK